MWYRGEGGNHNKDIAVIIANFVTIVRFISFSLLSRLVLNTLEETCTISHACYQRDTHKLHADLVANQRRALLVQGDAATAPADFERNTDGGLDNPDKGKNGERERGPVHERGATLLSEDSPERPGDRNARGEVALG